MASGMFTNGLAKILDGTIDLDTDTLKIMLVDSTYTYNPDTDVVDDGGGSDIQSAEITATNYTAGHGGAGRKTATITLQANDTDNRVDVAIADLTWTALGGATNDTVVAAVLLAPGTSDDTDAVPLAYFDLTDTPTNGSNFTLDFTALGSGGNIRLAV